MKSKLPLNMRVAGLAFAGLLSAQLALLAQSDGSGPEISVPKNPATGTAHVLPKPNWIDQSQVDADKKSRGCLECHAGVEPMHASPNVVLGCTDCHGGNATPGLKQTQAHVAPRNPVFW
jgi:hypothetical protein